MRAIRVWAAAMVIAFAQAGAATPAQAEQAFSAYSEIKLPATQNFPKWQQVREQLAAEAKEVEICLRAADCIATAAEIAGRLRTVTEESPLAQAEAVHLMMNARPYREDRRQFGRNDVWQSAFAFWEQGGDCEDYAIAKYMVFSALGFSQAQLRLTVMTSRSRGEVHAVLLIEIDGAWYVSDNLKRELRRLDRYKGWNPVFSVSEAGAWRYILRPSTEGEKLAITAAEPAAQPTPSRARLL